METFATGSCILYTARDEIDRRPAGGTPVSEKRDDKSKKPPAGRADAKPRPGGTAGVKGIVIDLEEYRKRKGR